MKGSWQPKRRSGQLARNPANLISDECIPAETKFNGERAEVNWTFHLKCHVALPTSANSDTLEQGTVPIPLSNSQMRNLCITIKHTPQCDKIT